MALQALQQLSPVFKLDVEQRSSSWVQVYREMTEWAVLFSLVREKDFGTDTVIVCDGFLRSKMFAKDSGGEGLFKKYREGLRGRDTRAIPEESAAPLYCRYRET